MQIAEDALKFLNLGINSEIAAYVFLGGMAGIVTVRRGDKLQVFVQAGIAVAVVDDPGRYTRDPHGQSA